jgi:hypothetical protein
MLSGSPTSCLGRKKGTNKIRACIDFRDLNGDTPKDEYPMTIANMLASGHKIINFLDGNTWCNRCLWPKKIRLRPRFPAPVWLVYLNGWLTFELKNASATYHRVMNLIFHDFLGVILEVYG